MSMRGGRGRKKGIFIETQRFKEHSAPVNSVIHHGKYLVSGTLFSIWLI